MADAQLLPHGGNRAGDRHLKFYETRDNLPSDGSSATGCTRFGYDNNGVRTSTTYPTVPATTISVTPDNTGRTARIRAVTGTPGSGSTVHTDLSYTYDRMVAGTPTAAALVDSRADSTATGAAGRLTRYSYDTLARLTRASETNSTGGTTAEWNYSYDRAGNRTSASLTGTPGAPITSFGYNDANMLISRNGSTTGFGHDANGNQTAAVGAKTRSNSTYSTRDQLTALTADGTTVPFSYHGADQQSRLPAGPTGYRTSPQGVTASTVDGATTSFIRDPGGGLVALRTSAGSFYYLFDNLGSVTGLVNAAGSKVNSYSYDPYGISRAKTEQVPNPFEYTGGQLDDATGLYKLGIRYYDPTLGRFTEPDPTGQDPHYTYAQNSPCSYTDPTGADSCLIVGRVYTNAGEIKIDFRVYARGFAISYYGIYVAVFGTRGANLFQPAAGIRFPTTSLRFRRSAGAIGRFQFATIGVSAGGPGGGCSGFVFVEDTGGFSNG